MKKIILASTSPRRRELLEKTGLTFEVVSSNYEENMALPLEPHNLAKHLSRGKAEAAAKNYKNAIVIAADTFVVFNNKILGKPHTAEKAKKMLLMLNGTSHSVITGFTIIDTTNGKSTSQSIETKVYFKRIPEKDIDEYIATGEPLDKGGAYAIQGLGGKFIDKIEGDYSSVVGLPIEDVLIALKEFGVKI